MTKLFTTLSLFLCITASAAAGNSNVARSADGSIVSIDTQQTILNVRTANGSDGEYIVGNSYDGMIIAVSYNGKIMWENPLSGFVNHDIYCGDITGDGVDEIFAANADGTLYCLDDSGKELWHFRPCQAPMNTVCVVKYDTTPYVACAGFDRKLYHLNAKGEVVSEIDSESYSKLKAPRDGAPAIIAHIMNYLRPMQQENGKQVLVAHAYNRLASSESFLYLFKDLEPKPYFEKSLGKINRELIGWMNVDSSRGEVVLGTDSNSKGASVTVYNFAADKASTIAIGKIGNFLGFGYRTTRLANLDDNNYFALIGSNAIVMPKSLMPKECTVYSGDYSYNDLCQSPTTNKVILASTESGGSAVHIIDFTKKGWAKSFENLTPIGNITSILTNHDLVNRELSKFKAPSWEDTSRKVFFMSESKKSDDDRELIENCSRKYDRLIFTQSLSLDKEGWDRMDLENEQVRKWRDGRMKYILTQDQVLDKVEAGLEGEKGATFWGGHGPDIYFYQLSTLKKIIDMAGDKYINILYPEITNHDSDFQYSMDHMMTPLTKYAQGTNTKLYIRTKHSFWWSHAYLPMWENMRSGEYADVYVPSMEESSCKSMDINIAARTGYWASGAVDHWGARCARDNTAYHGARRRSHQMLPNHFLRYMIYTISMGAQYLDNFNVNQEYMSQLWELIGKGALYVPTREEIVSFSPVHLAMKEPDPSCVYDGNTIKWITIFDEQKDNTQPYVFGRLKGTWLGAPVTDWDFSRYASGEHERRLTPLPPTENGLVLITPPQEGVFADVDAPRGAMCDKLHPIYKAITKEYITDGRSYYSADGTQKYAANEYYKTIEEDIKRSSKLIPITVSGGAAWVVAQTAPKHLRLTLVDGGFINPAASVAKVSFNTVAPIEIRDILSGEKFKAGKNGVVEIPIVCGGFRFIDVEIANTL